MKKKLIFLFAIISLMVFPASATLINTTCVEVYTGVFQGADYPLSNGLSITAPDSSPVLLGHQFVASEGSTTTIQLRQNSGNIITLETAIAVPNPFLGVVSTNINGGIVTNVIYPRLGLISNIWQGLVTPIVTAYVVDSDGNYYLVSDSENNLLAMEYSASWRTSRIIGARYLINTSTTSYIPIDNPATNPIRSASYSTTASGGTITLAFTTQETTQTQIDKAKNDQDTNTGQLNWWDSFVDLAHRIIDVAIKMVAFAATLSSYLFTGIAFLFMAQVFLVIVATYTVINVVMSIHDSDDLFRSFAKFWRRELKLLRFFMEIFGWVKQIIKWW
jgi:hypothetical protein